MSTSGKRKAAAMETSRKEEAATTTASSQNDPLVYGKQILIGLKDRSVLEQDVLYFRLFLSTPFEKLFMRYAERKHVSPESFTFFLGDEVLYKHQRPKDWNLHDDDIIDVYSYY